MATVRKVTAEGRRSAFRESLAQFYSQKKRNLTAYYCMEFGIRHDLPIYGGGLGILAGDTVKSAADIGDPMVAVGLLYRAGYFRQEFIKGKQESYPEVWDPSKHPDLVDLDDSVEVQIEGKQVGFRMWGHKVLGHGGEFVPLVLLDSLSLPNPRDLESITEKLYYKDPHSVERLRQDMALGVGGTRALIRLGLDPAFIHLNEGHAAFAPVEFMRSRLNKSASEVTGDDIRWIRGVSSFTTHTPVSAGFDSFHRNDIAREMWAEAFLKDMALRYGCSQRNMDFVDMANLAMTLSGRINGVSVLHADVSENMFPEFRPIIPITNGVHHLSWVSDPIAGLYDEFCEGWREDPGKLRKLEDLIGDEDFKKKLWAAHFKAKAGLCKHINDAASAQFDPEVFTIGFARRFAPYKRAWLIFKDMDVAMKIAKEHGRIQIVIAGKAHPDDHKGQEIIEEVIKKGAEITKGSKGRITVVVMPNYNLDSAKLLVSGVDIWLNTPIQEREASGTSGMKAALNGVPHVSTWDGWWPEGSREDKTGWTIGERRITIPPDDDSKLNRAHSRALYSILPKIMEAYYGRGENAGFATKMAEAMALNGSYFNTQRMVQEYRGKVWAPGRSAEAQAVKKETSQPREKKLLDLADIVFALASVDDFAEAERIVAASIISNLPAFKAARYDVRHGAVKLDRRWSRGSFEGNIFEESKNGFGTSRFAHWRTVSDFHGEVMEDLLKTGKIQVVLDPEKDKRCYRDGRRVSDSPFIFIPEAVNGEIMGVYKVDLSKGAKIGDAFEVEFIERLMKTLGLVKARIIRSGLEKDLSRYASKEALTHWAMALLTAGGFVYMPRHAKLSNRAAYFESREGDLLGSFALGDVSMDDRRANFARLGLDMYTENVESRLREYNQTGGALNKKVAGQRIGKNIITAPILVQHGIPIYDPKSFTGTFDAKELANIIRRIEGLFTTDGRNPEEYLLIPVPNSSLPHGLIYVDNFFTNEPLSADEYADLASAFGQSLTRLEK